MTKTRRKQLEKTGWKIGTVQELLGLSDDEMALIDIRISLEQDLKDRILSSGLTRRQLARHLKTTLSVVGKLESMDPSISLDLLIQSLLKLGATCSQIGRVIGKISTGHVA
ncbi:MAG: transcriptional regulator [Planctomycetota bacterium]